MNEQAAATLLVAFQRPHDNPVRKWTNCNGCRVPGSRAIPRWTDSFRCASLLTIWMMNDSDVIHVVNEFDSRQCRIPR